MKTAGLRPLKPQIFGFGELYGIGFFTVSLIFILVSIPQFIFGQGTIPEIGQGLQAAPFPSEKGLVVCTREVRLKPDVDPKAFEKWIMDYWNPEWQDYIPGLQSYISRGDLENEAGRYKYFLVFNSRKIHPREMEQADHNTEWYRELFYYSPTKHLFEELFSFIEISPFFDNRNWIELK